MTDIADASMPAAAAHVMAPVRAVQTKSAAVQKLLSRNKGATLAEIMAATHWQPHSTRSFLTGLRRKGVVLIKEARTSGETCWRIDR